MQADTPLDRITILNWETDQEVGVVHMDGTVETDDAAVRSLFEMMADGRITTDESGKRTCTRGVGSMTGYTRDAGSGRPVIIDAWVLIPPGSPSFLRAVRDSLPSPYKVPREEDEMLPCDIGADSKQQSELEAALNMSADAMTEEELAESVFEFVCPA